jgi:hypothetical protein
MNAVKSVVQHLGGRKFLLALAALIALTFLCYVGKIDGAQFIQGLLGTVGGFLFTNYQQKKVEAQTALAVVKPSS